MAVLNRLQRFRRWVWGGVTHPVSLAIAAATVIHGLILAIPVPDKNKPEPEPTPTETIKLSSLLGAVPPPKPKPKPTPPPSPTPTPTPKQEEPKPEPRALTPEEKVQAAPAPAPAPPSGEGDGDDGKGGEGDGDGDGDDGAGGDDEGRDDSDPLGKVNGRDPNAVPGGKSTIEELRKLVLARLSLSSNSAEQDIKDYMASIPVAAIAHNQVSFFVKGAQGLPDNAYASLAMPNVTLDDAYRNYVQSALVDNLDYFLTRKDPGYGEADLYFAAHQNKDLEFYFSLVELKPVGGASLDGGVFMVIWQGDPR